MAYESRNKHKHKNTDSLYAHYSMIDDYNYDIFPKLRLANPNEFVICSVSSISRCFFCAQPR